MTSTSKPLVSVVMAVKNGEARIQQSINSLLNQTFYDFELIIINDGSTDRTVEIIESFKDPRIHLFSQANRGVAISANRGLALAEGAFIARQDHDDLSRPERLQKQVSFLIENPEIFLVGTCAEIHNSQGFTGRYHNHPTNSKRLAQEILFDNPFVHSSIMFRREVIKSVGYYQPLKEITPLDDYDFISRVASTFKVANLSEYLVEYFEGENTLTSELRFANSSKKNALKEKQAYIMARNMAGIIGPRADINQFHFLSRVYSQCDSIIRGKRKFKEIRNNLNEVLTKFDSLYGDGDIELKDEYLQKLNHLEYCWYTFPKVASHLDQAAYQTKIHWIRFKYALKKLIIGNLVHLRDFIMKLGSKVKRIIFNSAGIK